VDYYEVLAVEPEAEQDDVKVAWRSLQKAGPRSDIYLALLTPFYKTPTCTHWFNMRSGGREGERGGE